MLIKKKLEFIGIDNWNRPVFKHGQKFYGSTDKLFSYYDDKEKVLSSVDVNDLQYFGSRFNCEPAGGQFLSNNEYMISN